MWNKAASNKHLDKLAKQQAYTKHIYSLYHVKSSIDNRPPKQFTFLNTRPKAYQKKIEQQETIENGNKALVQKMKKNLSSIQIMKKKLPTSVYAKDSLCTTVNKKRNKQIQQQNRFLVQRIKSAKSRYSKNQIEKSSNFYQGYKSNMAFSRMDPYYDLSQSMNNIHIHIQKSRRTRPATAKR